MTKSLLSLLPSIGVLVEGDAQNSLSIWYLLKMENLLPSSAHWCLREGMRPVSHRNNFPRYNGLNQHRTHFLNASKFLGTELAAGHTRNMFCPEQSLPLLYKEITNPVTSWSYSHHGDNKNRVHSSWASTSCLSSSSQVKFPSVSFLRLCNCKTVFPKNMKWGTLEELRGWSFESTSI